MSDVALHQKLDKIIRQNHEDAAKLDHIDRTLSQEGSDPSEPAKPQPKDKNGSPWWKTTLEVTTVAALVAALVVNIYQWREANRSAKVSQDVFEAQFRPYLTAEAVTTTGDSPLDKGVFIGMKIENTGSIPAENITYVWSIYKNGVAVPGISIPHGSRILYPSKHVYQKARMDDPAEVAAAHSGTLILTVYSKYSYHWREKYEEHCSAYQYEPTLNLLADLGETCDPHSK
jgi:hypothetical protein